MKRVALFGGAFDPPHLGHVLAAVWARSIAGVDAVWVLPVAEHPYGKPVTPFAQRLRLCELAFADLPFVSVRSDERDNPGGRTFTLLEHLQATYSDTRFALVGGTDTERDLPNWYRGQDLLAAVDIIAIPRRGYDDVHPGALPAISSSLVREALRTGASTEGLLPTSVAEAITTLGWYR